MGGSVSKNYQKSLTVMSENLKSTCSNSSQISQTVNCNITIDHCDNFKSLCKAGVSQGFNCDSSQVAKAVSNEIFSQGATALQTLGYSSATNVSDLESLISATMDAKCTQNVSVDQVVNGDVICKFSKNVIKDVIADSSDLTQCRLAVAADMLNQIQSTQKAAAGSDWAIALYIILGVVVLIVIIVVAVKYGSKGGRRGGGGGGRGRGGENAGPKSAPVSATPAPVSAPAAVKPAVPVAAGGIKGWR